MSPICPSLRTRTALGEEVDILCGPAVPASATEDRALSTSPTLEARMQKALCFDNANYDRELGRRFESEAAWLRGNVDTPSSTLSSPGNCFTSTELLTPASSLSPTRSSSFSNGTGCGKIPSRMQMEHYQPNDNYVRHFPHVSPPTELETRRIYQSKRTQSLPIVPRKRSSPTVDIEPLDRSPMYRQHSQPRLYPENRYGNPNLHTETARQILPGIHNLLGIAEQSVAPSLIAQPLSRRNSGVDPLDVESGPMVGVSTNTPTIQIRPIKADKRESIVVVRETESSRSYSTDSSVLFPGTPTAEVFFDASQSDTSSRSASPTKRRRSETGSNASSGNVTIATGGGVLAGRNTVNKRKFLCQTCGKFFTTSGHLSRHGRTHTGERKYECPHPTCDARFSRQDNCMQHFRTHSNNDSRRKKRKPAGSVTLSADDISTLATPSSSNGPDLLAALANAAALADRGGIELQT